MNGSVGPLTTLPATIGETATTFAGAAAIASRTPGTARIGPIEITGFEGPMMMARAEAIASSVSGGGEAALVPPRPIAAARPSGLAPIIDPLEGLPPPPAIPPGPPRRAPNGQPRSARAERAAGLASA